ncbi:MAG: M56 family metallopeptidase [Pirellulaceae bacterium]|nr:M56 family metallopeptidase [Planctomycetales bacterium]
MLRISIALTWLGSVLLFPCLDAAMKGTLVLAITLVATWCLRGDSAAMRHMLLTAAVTLILAMPLLSRLLPEWSILPNWPIWQNSTAASGTMLPMHTENQWNEGTERPSNATFVSDVEVQPVPNLAVGTMPLDPFDHPDSSIIPSRQDDSSTPQKSTVITTEESRWVWLVTGSWIAGCAILLVRFFLSMLALRAVETRCNRAGTHCRRIGDDAELDRLKSLHEALANASKRIGIGRPVRLLVDPQPSIPMVWGVLRPRLRLPMDALQWSDDQLRSVLLHELAHIQRHDALVLMMTQLACAFHWYNPLVWFVARRMHLERERACDDRVLNSGVRASAYAEHVMAISLAFPPCKRYLCGLAMAHPSSLDGRLKAVLNPKLNRRELTRVLAAGVLVVGLAITTPIAMLRANAEIPPTPEAAGSPDSNSNTVADTGKQVNDTMLPPAVEAQLDWGETVNGLRGAIIIRKPTQELKTAVYLVVQNVSENPIRFVDTKEADDLRWLYLSNSGRVLLAFRDDAPSRIDVTLQPMEIAYLPLIYKDDRIVAAMIEGIRKDSMQTWRAVLHLVDAPEGAWTGKLTTGETRATVRVDLPQPSNAQAQALYKLWQANSRLNGDIPGGLLHMLQLKVQEFIGNNLGDSGGDAFAKKMAPLMSRFDDTGDWKPADVVALLDDIAKAHPIPLETTLEQMERHRFELGVPLPKSWAGAAWGDPLPCGLRMACVLEPQATEYHLDSEIRARIVLHNAGTLPVNFLTSSFQQPAHVAKLTDGSELPIESTTWLTLGRMQACRLSPGQYCEIPTPGLGIGARNNENEDWSNVRAGSWILCQEGNEVILQPGSAELGPPHEVELQGDQWWLNFITERLNRETPVPADRTEREYLLYRVVMELFGQAPSTTIGEAFANDHSPDALRNLAITLSNRSTIATCSGSIRPGQIRFRVLGIDEDAGQRPRVATEPGWYTLGDSLRLSVTRRPLGEQAVNEASLIYFRQGQNNLVHHITLPSGHQTWAAVHLKGTTEMWLGEEGLFRRFDFRDPVKVVETRFEGDRLNDSAIPTLVREAVIKVLSQAEKHVRNFEDAMPAAADEKNSDK